MQIETIPYAGWDNCYRLANGLVELVVTGEVGPRIIRFGFLDQENEFKEFEGEVGLTGGEAWRSYGGHRLWHAPEAMPRSYVPDNSPVEVTERDGDVVFHAICNAITSLTHVPILGKIAIDLCHKEGITDSRVYLNKAYETLGSQKIEHVALTIEGKRPKFQKRAKEIRQSVANALNLSISQVGITFTSGDALTAFGKGEGLMCYSILTTVE